MNSVESILEIIKVPKKRAILPLALLVIGLALITLQLLNNVTAYVRSVFVEVSRPTAYYFPAYDALLRRHVKGDLVDYKALSRDPELSRALTELEKVSPENMADSKTQIAFWINCYNLLIVKNVVDHYPINTIKSIDGELSLRKFLIGGKTYSVSDIQEGQILPRLAQSNPKAVFLMCGGAMGFPPLTDHALDAEHLEDDITTSIHRFVNNPKNLSFDYDIGVISLSPFIRWHWKLFIGEYDSPWLLIAPYLDPLKQMEVKRQSMTQEFAGEFNWWLNDIALKGRDEPRQPATPEIDNLNLVPYSESQ